MFAERFMKAPEAEPSFVYKVYSSVEIPQSEVAVSWFSDHPVREIMYMGLSKLWPF
jgi:hypothetical protein